MKILILIKKWSGGVGRVINSIKPLLEKKGYKIEIISREDDLKCFSLKDSFRILRKEVNKRNYDILYIQDWSCALPLIDKKSFVCFHGEDISKSSRFLQVLVGKIKGRKLIVVGDKLKKLFPKSSLIYNGVDLNKFKQIKNIKKIKNSVGFANWLTDKYNFNKIKKAVNETEKKLIVAKNIQKEKMPEFYNKIEAFISLPPEYTGFNLVWLEAMACGVPKIIGNNAGIGKKLPINHIEDFSSIEEAIKSSKRRNYRKWVLDNKFTWENHVNKFLEVYKKCLK